MLYSRAHMAAVDVKGLSVTSRLYVPCLRFSRNRNV